MAQIVKIACPDCGHLHTRNSNRFTKKTITLNCKNCGTDFVYDHSLSTPISRKSQNGNQAQEIPDINNKNKGDHHPQTRELKIKWNHIFRIYWAWFWRTVLFSLLFCLIFGLPLGFAVSMLNLIKIQPIFTAFGLFVGIIISFWKLRTVLRKNFRGFRIALIQD